MGEGEKDERGWEREDHIDGGLVQACARGKDGGGILEVVCGRGRMGEGVRG